MEPEGFFYSKKAVYDKFLRKPKKMRKIRLFI